MKKNNVHIGVIGLWHLGSVYSSCFAEMGYTVTGFDFDRTVVDNLAYGIPPLYEPQLKETVKKHINKNLQFTHSAKEICKDKDYIFITFDLPVDDNDNINLELMYKAEKLLSQNISDPTTVVVSSQVPLGTTRKLYERIKKQSKQNINIVYFPENLRLGKAFDSFLKPDRIILGVEFRKIATKFIHDFPTFKCPFQVMTLESAEMVKHALNTYLATCISYSSEIADVSERLGADMRDVVAALKTDKRVSPFAPINPGMGFAGGTLGRDIRSLMKLGKTTNYKMKLMETVYTVNKDRIGILMKKISSLLPSLSQSNVGILGLTYKPGTSTLRRSLSLDLARLLHSKRAQIKAYDPMVQSTIVDYPYVKICQTPEVLFQDTDTVILMTEWPEFLKLEVSKVSKLMRKKIIIDSKNFLDEKIYIKEGFIYKGIGF